MATKTAVYSEKAYPLVPRPLSNNFQNWANFVTNVSNNNAMGRCNNRGQFTLVASTVSTVIKLSEGMLAEDSVVIYFPLTASAATEFGAGSIFMSSRDVSAHTFTLTHASTADTDKVFAFVLIG